MGSVLGSGREEVPKYKSCCHPSPPVGIEHIVRWPKRILFNDVHVYLLHLSIYDLDVIEFQLLKHT